MVDIYKNDIRQIEEQLYHANGIFEKVACIEDFLLKKLNPISLHDERMLQKSIELIKQQKGQITASTLSEKVSFTPKSLERKFSQFLGKSPKQFIKLVRFQETLKDFSLNADRNITEYAYRNGYFDQAHFIKDFKTFSGYTPKAFFVRYPDFNNTNDWC